MDAALKSVVVSELRARGYTGSLPHLRHRRDDGIRLISFQYFSSGGSFVAEVAACPARGITTSWGKEIPAAKVTAQDVSSPRPRLGSDDFPASGDHWFVFGLPSYEEGAGALMAPDHYESVAAHVLKLVDEQAEPFWRSQAGNGGSVGNE